MAFDLQSAARIAPSIRDSGGGIPPQTGVPPQKQPYPLDWLLESIAQAGGNTALAFGGGGLAPSFQTASRMTPQAARLAFQLSRIKANPPILGGVEHAPNPMLDVWRHGGTQGNIPRAVGSYGHPNVPLTNDLAKSYYYDTHPGLNELAAKFSAAGNAERAFNRTPSIEDVPWHAGGRGLPPVTQNIYDSRGLIDHQFIGNPIIARRADPLGSEMRGIHADQPTNLGMRVKSEEAAKALADYRGTGLVVGKEHVDAVVKRLKDLGFKDIEIIKNTKKTGGSIDYYDTVHIKDKSFHGYDWREGLNTIPEMKNPATSDGVIGDNYSL